jgi:hypothetical protein
MHPPRQNPQYRRAAMVYTLGGAAHDPHTFGAGAVPLLQRLDREIPRLPRGLRGGAKRLRDALKLAESGAGARWPRAAGPSPAR